MQAVPLHPDNRQDRGCLLAVHRPWGSLNIISVIDLPSTWSWNPPEARTSKAAEDLIAMAESYAKKLVQLQKTNEFRLSELETIIDEIRGLVSELLWKLMVQEADLFGHLRVIKGGFQDQGSSLGLK